MNENKTKKKIIIIISIIVTIALILGGVYLFLSSKEKKEQKDKETEIKEENVSLTLNKENIIQINKKQLTDEEGEKQTPYHFTIKNESDKETEYMIYLDDLALDEKETKISDDLIKYSLIKEKEKKIDVLTSLGDPSNRVLDKGFLKGKESITYDLRLWTNRKVTNQTFKGKLRIEVKEQDAPVVVEPSKTENSNILAVYQYDDNCQTGEEEACQPLAERPTTYEPGMIINYRVNQEEAKYFYVLFDNGDTLTLQQRENTIVTPTPWYDQDKDNVSQTTNDNETKADPKVIPLSAVFLAGSYLGDNDKGPLTVLKTLENATANWTNVKNQTYTLGSTVFKENAYTGCAYDANTKKISCTENRYTMPERTGKARMITVQEAIALGCSSEDSSCPTWMHQYLNNDLNDQQKSTLYWTMSAPLSRFGGGYAIGKIGNIEISITTPQPICSGNVIAGARAVIVIDK